MSSAQQATQRVLIVDDDEAVLDSLRLFLEAAGLAVDTWTDPTAFLADWQPERRGCLLLDCRMPSMSGLDLQEGLLAVGSSLPIIFITGHADVPTAVQALKAGAFDFLQKPFDQADLLDLIRQAFALDQRNAQLREQHRELRERLASLTPREREVLDGVVEGKATKVIALDLKLSQRTVDIYRANVMQKMQTRSLAQLVRSVAELKVDGGA